MKKFCLLLSGVLLFCYAPAQDYLISYDALSANMPLSSAIRIGIDNNTDLLRVEQEIIIAEQKTKENRSLRYPQISVMGTATKHNLDYPMVLPEEFGLRFLPPDTAKNTFYGAGVTAYQYLYSGGRINASIDISKARTGREKSRYETMRNTVIFNVKEAFFTLLHAQERARFSEEILSKAESFYKRASFKGWERVEADALLEQIRSVHNEADKELRAARARMLAVLNREPNNPVGIEGKFAPVQQSFTLGDLNILAMEMRPEVRTAIFEVAETDIDSSLGIGFKFPDVILGASYDRLGDDSLGQENSQVSLAVRLPITFTYNYRARQKEARQRENFLKRSATEDMVKREVESAFNEYNFWRGETERREKSYSALRSAFNSAERSAGAGLESMRALNAYTQVAFSYCDSVKENLLSFARLEWAAGHDLK